MTHRSQLLGAVTILGLCVVMAMAAETASSPTPPTWPTAFNVSFFATVVDFNIFGTPSTLYYDWSLKSQRIDFSSGCPASGSGSQGCSVLFTPTTAYLLTEADSECCITAPVGCLPPDWMSGVLDFVNDTTAFGNDVEWFSGGTPTHNYMNDPTTESGVLLIVEDICEMWQFVSPFAEGPQDPSLFSLPPLRRRGKLRVARPPRRSLQPGAHASVRDHMGLMLR